jgi:chromosome segregation ATPase
MDRNYSDQLEQEISKNRKLAHLLCKARRQSRQHKDQLKDLEHTVKKNEIDLQEPWAESHKLLNQLRELKRTKDDAITILRSTISTKDTELANAAESTQALRTQLSEAQGNAQITLHELDRFKNVERMNCDFKAENVALTSRIEVLERDLALRDTTMAHCTTRLERLTTRNTELKRRLKNSLRENEEVRKR